MDMKRVKKRWLFGIVAGCGLLASMPGCELLVDFDRTKIPSDSGSGDSTVGMGDDGSVGADAGSIEAGPDAEPDAFDAGGDVLAADDAPDGAVDGAADGTLADGADAALDDALDAIAPDESNDADAASE